MVRVRALAHASQTVQRRNSEARGEVAVRTATHRRLSEPPPELLRDLCRFPVERCYSCCAFHGRTVQTATDFQLALGVEGPKRAQLAIDS